MRLEVTGVETIEITDPGRLIRRRKTLDPEVLREMRGQVLTAHELKGLFGYATTTALIDTQLKRHIEAVVTPKRSTNRRAGVRWRVV